MSEITVGSEWRVQAMTTPRGLAGANGIRIGPDGGLYAVSAFGSQLAKIDVDTGALTLLSGPEGEILSPDDLAFGSDGVIFVSECMHHRVSAFDDGRVWVVAEGISDANGICTFEDRIFVNEFRAGGRLLEVFLDGRAPVVLADGLAGPNGMTVGPDRHIYFVQVFAGDVLRVSIDGGVPERVLGDLTVPSSARIAADGSVVVSQAPSGEVIRFDPRTGERSTVVRARRGIDNLDVDASGRMFLSYYADGAIAEVVGESTRDVVPPGLMGPFGLATTADGITHIADGLSMARLHGLDVEPATDLLDPGFPGCVRGLAPGHGGLYTTTSAGQVALYDYNSSEVLTEELEVPMGVAEGADGTVLVAEAGRGRVVALAGRSVRTYADGLSAPSGIAVDGEGVCFAADEGAGELLRLTDGGRDVLLDGLDHPQGVAIVGGDTYVVEAGAKRLLAVATTGGEAREIASNLPVGLPGGGVRSALPGLHGPLAGPVMPFAALAAQGEQLAVSGDQTGVVLLLERSR